MTNRTEMTELLAMTQESLRLHARFTQDKHKIAWLDGTQGLPLSDPLAIQFEERTAEMHAHDKKMSGAYLAYAAQTGLSILEVIDAINDRGELVAA